MSEESKKVRKDCPVCGENNVTTFIKIEDMPVHCCLLWNDKEKAIQTDRGDIELCYCSNCGHIYNASFDPERINYSKLYENALYFSGTFQDYAHELAVYLVKKYRLRSKKIIDIGCGQGYFLSMLCEMGNNRGYGFDPGFRIENQDLVHTENVNFIRDYYSAEYADYKADLIVCRQVLEHIYDPVKFLSTIRMALYDHDSVVFFEVPNAQYMLDKLSVWDVIYEHHSYFSKSSLQTLLTLNGFKINRIDEVFDHEYLALEARPQDDISKNNGNGTETGLDFAIDSFQERFKAKVEKWEAKVELWSKKNEKIVLWGAGSKGMAFLSILRNSDLIKFIVDVNPRKQNKFLNGNGQKIIAPEIISDYKPDHVILMNPIYQEEITDMIHGLGIDSDVVLV